MAKRHFEFGWDVRTRRKSVRLAHQNDAQMGKWGNLPMKGRFSENCGANATVMDRI
ncbi:MAG: hypothetical protein ABJN22_10270 [Litorimonas sp.]